MDPMKPADPRPNKIFKGLPVRIGPEGNRIVYRCPKCRESLIFRKKRDSRGPCVRCGQALDWSTAEELCAETITADNTEEAAWIAEQYREIGKIPDGTGPDTDEGRLQLSREKSGAKELYLLFFRQRDLRGFMRRYRQEGLIPDG